MVKFLDYQMSLVDMTETETCVEFQLNQMAILLTIHMYIFQISRIIQLLIFLHQLYVLSIAQ
jgi:hypothetical protein